MTSLLDIKNLNIEYTGIKADKKHKIHAVKDVSFHINEGEIYALAGESGCGKSSTAKAIMKLVKPSSGEILFCGNSIYNIKKDYPKCVQMIFQNPYSSLNPKMKIKDILEEPLIINTKMSLKERRETVEETLSSVGMDKSSLELYPHEFSGGQRQRIAIARALMPKPRLLIADEPVSALDASIQAQILNLLKDLRINRNLTILFISHDMNVIKFLADRVGIMYDGELIEENYTGTVFRCPKEEYTKILLNAVPVLKK